MHLGRQIKPTIIDDLDWTSKAVGGHLPKERLICGTHREAALRSRVPALFQRLLELRLGGVSSRAF